MLRRVPQPPVDRSLREREHHGFLIGFIVALIGVLAAIRGARHLTAMPTANGGVAWETQIVRAFASGGVQYSDKLPPPMPPRNATPQELERWFAQHPYSPPPAWKVRIDTESKAACPT